MGRKIKPCWFCESEHFDTVEEHGMQLVAEVYPNNLLIGITASGNMEDGNFREARIDIEMNFCPVCGRKCGL